MYKIKNTCRDYVVIREGGLYSQHSHFKSINGAKKVISLIQHKRLPKSYYLLLAAYRLVDPGDYKDKLEMLLQVKRDKGIKRYYIKN